MFTNLINRFEQWLSNGSPRQISPSERDDLGAMLNFTPRNEI